MEEGTLIEEEIYTIKVYGEIDENNRLIKIFSTIFQQPTDTSILLGEGRGDSYAHAHLFLDKPLIDKRGVYNYKYVDEGLVERTEEEKETDIVATEPQLTANDLLTQLIIESL